MYTTNNTNASNGAPNSAGGGGSTNNPTSPLKQPRRLTEEEKRQNHIASEQKRRQAIREGFDRLASMVPGMEGMGRSEAVVLSATIEHINTQVARREELVRRAREAGVSLEGLGLEDHVVKGEGKNP